MLTFDALGGTASNLLLVSVSIGVVEMGGLRVGRTGCVGVSEEGLDGGEDAVDRVDGGPLVLNDVKAQGAVCVDIWVEHFGGEADARRLLRVLFVEGEAERVDAALPRGLRWTEDGGAPHEKVLLTEGGSAAALRGLLAHVLEVSHEAETRRRWRRLCHGEGTRWTGCGEGMFGRVRVR